MTEDDAQSWIRERWGVSRETLLQRFVDDLTAEAERQNLVSASTLPHIWSRHVVDSAQLIDLAPSNPKLWVDIGTGAGLPGLVVALLSDCPTVLIEPRKLRVEFLQRIVAKLGLRNVVIRCAKSGAVHLPSAASVISARAVGSLPSLFNGAAQFADTNTLWLLPKGSSAASEVAAARATWQGMFHVEPSMTDASSGIIVARGVKRR